MDAAASASGDSSSVEPGTSGVQPSTSGVQPSTSSVEPSTSGVQPSVSPNSGNVDPDAPAAGDCPDGCTIAGTCYSSGDLHPSNACVACDPGSSKSEWTNIDGETCDDGLYCTVNDGCSAGKCVGDERACDDGVACNGAEACDETQEACASAESTCDEGQTCNVDTDECSSTCNGCIIDGSCYSDDSVSPSNPCMVCDPSTSPDDWSVALAATCDDGDACTSDDSCNAAGACAGSPSVGGDCDCIDDSDCDDGVTCTTDKCNDGTCSNALQAGSCRISNACLADGTADASNPCRYCDASSNPTWWTNSSPGASCDDGLWCNGADTCNAGSCTHEFPSGNRCTGTGACDLRSCDESVRSCFAPSSQVCGSDEEYRCRPGDSCGGIVQSRQLQTFCSGSASACTGTAAPSSNWADSDTCPAEQVCTATSTTSSCEDSIDCVAFCDSSNLCWSNEEEGHLTYASAATYCASQSWAGKAWQLPTVQQWVSVLRGCNDGIENGANDVSLCTLTGCSGSSCDDVNACSVCELGEGPDTESNGCYWIPDITGATCAVDTAGYWSKTGSPSGHWVAYASTGNVSSFGVDAHRHSAKCVTTR